MANQLTMDKSLAINNLRSAGYSQRRIARTLGVSRGAVRRHLAGLTSNDTTAPTGQDDLAPIGSEDSNSTKAPTGSIDETAPTDPTELTATSGSQCEPFRDVISEKIEAGLSARRIHQDLLADHGAETSYWSVNRFVKATGATASYLFEGWKSSPAKSCKSTSEPGRKSVTSTALIVARMSSGLS